MNLSSKHLMDKQVMVLQEVLSILNSWKDPLWVSRGEYIFPHSANQDFGDMFPLKNGELF